MGFKYIELGTILILGWIVIWLTFPFERKYDETMREYSREPLVRMLLGFILLIVAEFSVPVSLLLFLITFFWITDVHLVSSIKF
jgi:hypothetical protein